MTGQTQPYTIWDVVNRRIWPVGAEGYNTIYVQMTGQIQQFKLQRKQRIYVVVPCLHLTNY